MTVKDPTKSSLSRIDNQFNVWNLFKRHKMTHGNAQATSRRDYCDSEVEPRSCDSSTDSASSDDPSYPPHMPQKIIENICSLSGVLLFNRLGINPDFLEADPFIWMDNEEYMAGRRLVSTLS